MGVLFSNQPDYTDPLGQNKISNEINTVGSDIEKLSGISNADFIDQVKEQLSLFRDGRMMTVKLSEHLPVNIFIDGNVEIIDINKAARFIHNLELDHLWFKGIQSTIRLNHTNMPTQVGTQWVQRLKLGPFPLEQRAIVIEKTETYMMTVAIPTDRSLLQLAYIAKYNLTRGQEELAQGTPEVTLGSVKSDSSQNIEFTLEGNLSIGVFRQVLEPIITLIVPAISRVGMQKLVKLFTSGEILKYLNDTSKEG